VPQTEWEKSCNFKSIGDAAATTAKKRQEQSSLEDAILDWQDSQTTLVPVVQLDTKKAI